MPNINISLEDASYEWVEHEAQRLNVNVSQFLGELLKDEMLKANAYEQALEGWLKQHGVEPTVYADLKARQQENYNFHKVAAILADFGFTSIRLSDDWNGADFIALHKSGAPDLKVQLKGVFTLKSAYETQNLWICFRHSQTSVWYLYPHDDALIKAIEINPNLVNTRAWLDNGLWTIPLPGEQYMEWLSKYAIPAK